MRKVSKKDLPEYIQSNINKNKDYYSLYDMANVTRCKNDSTYLGDVMIVNENLIWHCIHKYVGNPDIIAKHNHIDKSDILQLGRMGFIKAIHAFDTERGVKFSSFAATAIMREVRCYLRDSVNIMRISRNAQRILRELRNLEEILGYAPSVEEAAEELEENSNAITKALIIGQPMKYLDAPRARISREEGGHSFAWAGGDTPYLIDDSPNPEDKALDKIYIQEVLQYLDGKLTPFEKEILYQQLEGTTQVQIAKEHGVSHMKVSRVMNKIMSLIDGYNGLT